MSEKVKKENQQKARKNNICRTYNKTDKNI
jgi:hypothetical protein